MNEVAFQQFKFGAAAYGIGVTEKTLRNWLSRGQVELVTERAENEAHFSFAVVDLVTLSVVAELVRYGCPVRTAFDGIAPIQRELRMLASYKSTPLGALAASLALQVVWAHSDGYKWQIIPNFGAHDQDNSTQKIGSFLMVSPGFCCSEVLRRIREYEEAYAALKKEVGEKEARRQMQQSIDRERRTGDYAEAE